FGVSAQPARDLAPALEAVRQRTNAVPAHQLVSRPARYPADPARNLRPVAEQVLHRYLVPAPPGLQAAGGYGIFVASKRPLHIPRPHVVMRPQFSVRRRVPQCLRAFLDGGNNLFFCHGFWHGAVLSHWIKEIKKPPGFRMADGFLAFCRSWPESP